MSRVAFLALILLACQSLATPLHRGAPLGGLRASPAVGAANWLTPLPPLPSAAEQGSGRKRRLDGDDENNNGGGQQRNRGRYGEKSMHQIQYFNAVLWTAAFLVVVAYVTMYVLLDMPLLPDSLLFGGFTRMMEGGNKNGL
jgi:hypothetical protein